jgi:hypothetical protein
MSGIENLAPNEVKFVAKEVFYLIILIEVLFIAHPLPKVILKEEYTFMPS